MQTKTFLPSARAATAGVLGALAALLAVPAIAAAATCPSATLSKPFASFGDQASYRLLAGGSFESGAPGWALTNASITGENERYAVAGGTHSLAIAANGTAVSPAFCVNSEYPSFRLFARRTGGTWGVLNVIVRWTQSGVTHETTSAALQSGTSWTVSPVLQLGSMLPVSQSSAVTVRLVLKPEPYGGPWAVDDVYVDPYSR